MPKFLVVGLVAANLSVEVDADDADAALESGVEAMPSPTVCWHCSQKLEVGEVYRYQVISDGGSGDVVYDDDPEVDVTALQRENERLAKELAAAKRALVANVKGTRKPRKKVA